jgi:serine phosphatase RsbU (regulator of sigma subunit)
MDISSTYWFIGILVLITIGWALIFWYYKHKISEKKLSQRIQRIKKAYDNEIEVLKGEIKRLNFLLQDFKQKIKTGNTKSRNEERNETEKTQITIDSEKLEEEKKHFQEKNKKLWEQSLAIHKEKERINQLKKEIEEKHNMLTDSILYAKRIQTALLPSNEYIANQLREFFVLWKPRDIVSGDFYYVKRIGKKIVVAVADCTGHGVPGAFMGNLGIAFLHETLNNLDILDPGKILDEMRVLVKMHLRQTGSDGESKDGMDMALCVIDSEARKLQFAGANNPLYIYRSGEILEIAPVKNPIGIYIKEIPFVTNDIDLLPNDVCYLFSDGYTDEFGGPKGRKYTKNNFRQLLLRLNQEKIPVAGQSIALENEMTAWLGSMYKQIDDILVFGFKF